MKTRILSVFTLSVFFWAGMALSPAAAEKVTVGPSERNRCGSCPPGYRCKYDNDPREGGAYCVPKGN